MFVLRAIRGLVIVCASWLPCAIAAGGTVAAQIDQVYLDLGRGRIPPALQESAHLLNAVEQTGALRADVLGARLDVLMQAGQLDKPSGADLRERVAAAAAERPADRWLLDALAIARAYDKGDGKFVLEFAGTLGTRLHGVAASRQAELRSVLAIALATTAGRLDLAGKLAESALPAWRRSAGAKARWHELRLELLLAHAYATAGDEPRALALLETASGHATGAFGRDSALGLRVDRARAGLLSSLGRNSEGLRVRETILAATRRRYGQRSFETANAEALLGAGLQEIGDYPNAREHYRRALAAVSGLNDAPPRERGLIHANYANLLQEMGDEAGALANYRIALALFGGGDASLHARAVIEANIGNTEFRLHHFRQAILHFRHALAMREKSDGGQSPGLAYSLEGLGSASLALREFADAERYYRRALKLRGLTMAANHPTLGPLRFGLALARWGQGDARGAFDLAVQTARHQQSVLATFALDFAERQSLAYRELLTPATALTVTLAAQLGDRASIAMAWRLSMVERGLVARAESRRLAVARARTDPAAAAALGRWQHLNRLLGDAWFSAGTDAKKIDALRQQAEAAERAMWPNAAKVGRIATTASRIDILARALPGDGVLIAYTEGLDRDPARLLNAGDKQAPEDWYAFRVDHDGVPRLVRIGSIRALSAQVHAWYLDLRTPGSARARLRGDGRAVRQAVLDPVLAGSRLGHLFVVPEGELYRISFAALPDTGAHEYLIESLSGVHTLARESDLLLAPPRRSRPTVLLAGAPLFGAGAESAVPVRKSCDGETGANFAPIPNADRELDAVRGLIDNAARNARVDVLRGAQATRRKVMAALPRANLVHLATHGFAFDDECTDDVGRRGVSLSGVAGHDDSTSDAMLSGLAFAADDAGPAAAGILSAGDLATLDLSGLDWIVLSACDSGLGPIDRNEGVFGMRRALRVAGARTVVMSLWPVDDAATVGLMRALYRARFVGHRNVPDAMGDAMRSVLVRRRRAGLADNPYFWAAFVSEGAWR